MFEEDEQPGLFRGLSQREAGAILELGKRFVVPSGAVLFALGAKADKLYLVERGRIRLTLPMLVREREEDILVEESGPGDMVGWSALIPPFRYTLKATAPLETEVVAVRGETLRSYFTANPAIGAAVAMNLAAVIGRRLQLFQAMWLREIQRLVESHCA